MERFQTTNTVSDPASPNEEKFVRGLGLLDSTMLVAGSMIGSGIYIVSADIARLVGSSGWLLVVWMVTGALTIIAALSYGELAAMMPRAGGQYVYLREAYSPLWGFLYGWTLFLVIQTGTIAAVAVAFSRFLGVLVPGISPTQWMIPPIILSRNYAVSLSTQQLIAILIIALLTFVNTRGLRLGKIIQNVFTSAKTLSLLALIVLGIFVGRNADAIAANFAQHVDSCRRFSDQVRLIVRRDGVRDSRRARDVDCGLRGASRLAVFFRRVEQHHVHCR